MGNSKIKPLNNQKSGSVGKFSTLLVWNSLQTPFLANGSSSQLLGIDSEGNLEIASISGGGVEFMWNLENKYKD